MLEVGMTAATPVPLTGTALTELVTGLPTSTAADRAPVVVGAKLTSSWHEPPGASGCAQPDASRAKSPGFAPASWTCGVRLELLVLVSVKACAPDRVATRWFPNPSCPGA